MITTATWLAVAAGGAVGAPARFLLDRWVTVRVGSVRDVGQFPWGLLAVNGLGSLLAGVIVATTTGDLRILLLVGFCGAFTTFSGFAWETERLWSVARDAFWLAVVVVPVACVTLFLVAWRLAGLVGR